MITTAPPDVATAAAFVLRRVGFGATGADLDRAAAIGLDAFLDELFDPDAHGVADDGDPWDAIDLAPTVESRRDIAVVIHAWFDRMVRHERPVTEWLAWYWHGHLVTSAGVVRSPLQLVGQLRLFRQLGGGRFADLIRAVTVDPAMLRYLDGNESTGSAPNENYSRELLELFALGVGAYTEADVQAGARALTGWVARLGEPTARFVRARHDDTPQRYLGLDGVRDVDTVIDAVVAQPSCPLFVATRLATAILGAGVAEQAAGTVAPGSGAELEIRPLVRRLVDLGLDGVAEPFVLAPVPWLAWAVRATGSSIGPPELTRALRGAGQVPLVPPNVAGWPPPDDWLSTSATAARLGAAVAVAGAADPDGDAMRTAIAVDLDGLSWALGRPDGFTTTTADALLATGTQGASLLALALTAPELVIT